MKRKALSEWVRRRFDGSWVAAQAASENADAPLDDRFLRRFSDSGERLDADESSDDEAPSRHRPPKGTHAAKDAMAIDQRAVLRLSNLNYGTTATELSMRFAEYGRIVTCELDTDDDTGQRTGRALIRFDHPSGANAAAEAMDGLELGGRTINCRVAGRGAEGVLVGTVRGLRWRPCGARDAARLATGPKSAPRPPPNLALLRRRGVRGAPPRADGHQLHLLGIECPAVSASQAALDAILPSAMLCTKSTERTRLAECMPPDRGKSARRHSSAACVRRALHAVLDDRPRTHVRRGSQGVGARGLCRVLRRVWLGRSSRSRQPARVRNTEPSSGVAPRPRHAAVTRGDAI